MTIPLSTTVQAVKEMVLVEWPKDFPRAAPTDLAEVRLILNGKVLENGKTLADCRTPTVRQMAAASSPCPLLPPDGQGKKKRNSACSHSFR